MTHLDRDPWSHDNVDVSEDAEWMRTWAVSNSSTIAAVGALFTITSSAAAFVIEVENGWRTLNFSTLGDRSLFAAFLLLPLIGLLLVWRRPQNSFGWVLGAMGPLIGLNVLSHAWAIFALRTHGGDLPGGSAAAWLAGWTLVPAFGLLPFVPALFPQGRITHRWLRSFARVTLVALAALAVAQSVATEPLDGVASGVPAIPNPLGIEGIAPVVSLVTTVAVALMLLFTLAVLVEAVWRFQHSTGLERDQLRWVACALAIIPITMLIPSDLAMAVGQIGGLIALSLSIAIAVMRYRLYDLGDFLRRGGIYGLLSAAIVLSVVVVASLVGILFSTTGIVPAVAATAAVALALGPLRSRLQSAVDRMLFGRRHEPFAVLTDIGSRLATAIDPDVMLTSIVETVRDGLRVPFVGIELQQEPWAGRSIATGDATPHVSRFDLVHRFEVLGELVVGQRSADESFTEEETALFSEVARQVATVVQAVTASEALRAARHQIVEGREEERRRLRRDLHDGVGPTLAGAILQLDALRDVVSDDAVALLDKVKADVRASVDEVRTVARDLRPPALDELGLAGALRQRMANLNAAGLDAKLHMTEHLNGLPAAVEVAAYSIVSEALTNVANHAGAERCEVRLELTDHLDIAVKDDGRGMQGNAASGVGLVSMRERAEELGGTFSIESIEPNGTVVRAQIPVAN